MKAPPRRRTQPLLDRGLLTRSFLWLGLLEAGICYAIFLATYLFSGNAGVLNQPFLNAIHWPVYWFIPQDIVPVARTVFLTAVVIAQIGNAFACRTITAHNRQMGWGSNKVLLLGIGLAIALILGMVYLPVLARAFDNKLFPPIFWGFIVFGALLLYVFEWMRKSILRKFGKHRNSPPSSGS